MKLEIPQYKLPERRSFLATEESQTRDARRN
jgi:hypothetical protein